ncbi:PLP-dependent transferase [Caulobacter sp. UC70_42]|uniref:PLP-dependent transferase n=1 Tax=Caulobacter sp. UC70_42 TaxID=3374551 RepID=UPI003757C557
MTDIPGKNRLDFATRTIHGGQFPDPTTGAVMVPIYATSTYAQASPGEHKGFEYSRSHNPTRFAFERCIADLESGTAGFAFASGLAAASTILETLDSGAHVIASDDLYGGSFRLFDKVRKRSAGLTFSFVDMADLAAVRGGDHPGDADDLGGDAHQPDAAPGGSGGDRDPGQDA